MSLSPDATKKCFLKIVGGNVKEIPVDVVIPCAAWTQWGEDGTVQGLLEMAQYSLCGVRACWHPPLAMDKVYTEEDCEGGNWEFRQAKCLWLHLRTTVRNQRRFGFAAVRKVEAAFAYPLLCEALQTRAPLWA